MMLNSMLLYNIGLFNNNLNNKQTNLNIFILNDAQLFIAVQHGHLASQESASRCYRWRSVFRLDAFYTFVCNRTTDWCFGYLWKVEKEKLERKQTWKLNVEIFPLFDVKTI